MKKYILFVVLLVLIGAVWLFKSRVFPVGAEALTHSGTAIVVTSAALQSLAATVGGEHVTTKIVTAKDTTAIYSADIFMFSGDGSDGWADGLAPDLAKKQIVPMKLYSGEKGKSDPAASHTLALRLAHVLSLLDPTHAQSYSQNAQIIK